jgi:leucyl-tRNA synthetase
MAEELWSRMGHPGSLAYEPWPVYDDALLRTETVPVAVQVNGKVRGTIHVDPEAPEDSVLAAARADENVSRHLDGKTLRRAVYVPGRIVNFVVS